MEQNEQTYQIDWDSIPNMAYTKAYSLCYGNDEEIKFTKSKTWMKLIKALANKLIVDYPSVNLSNLIIPGSKDYFCYDDKSYLNWPIDLDNGMFFEGNLSAVKAVNLAAALIDYCKADKSKIVIKYLGRDSAPAAPASVQNDAFQNADDTGRLRLVMELCSRLSPEAKKELTEWLNKQ